MTAPESTSLDQPVTYEEWALRSGVLLLPYPSRQAAESAQTEAPHADLVTRTVTEGPWVTVHSAHSTPDGAEC